VMALFDALPDTPTSGTVLSSTLFFAPRFYESAYWLSRRNTLPVSADLFV